eukprot:jgi/Tetstr1/435549/TSEL_024453.t1
MPKRSYKLQEFVAHSSNVNCLKIGRKSSGVLVTGGDDRKVNVWAIGKPNAILSLSGHQSPVDCVTFDSAEEVVVAGAQSGTVKIWDLEEAKVVRTLTGHRSNCQSVDFHPFGEYLASGSLDTNVKVWDVRNKGCIHTYKGHTRGVAHLRFSPDGRWIASGSEDGTIKIWDLTAGKMITDINQHTHPITGLEFHPNEFLLGSSSMDRSIKFWDLETFDLVDTAGPDALPARAIHFTPDGSHLLAAQQDGLRVYSWEPAQQHDWVDAAWTKVADMSLHEGKLIGCSFHQTFVGVWVVDLTRVKPFAAGVGAGAGTRTSRSSLSSGRSGEDASAAPAPAASRDKAPERVRPAASSSGRSRPSDGRPRPADNPQLSAVGTSAPAPDRRGRDPALAPAPVPVPPAEAPRHMVSIGTGIGDSLPMGGVDFAGLRVGAEEPPPAAVAQRGSTPDLAAPAPGAPSASRTPSAPQPGLRRAAPAAPGSAPACGPQPQGLDLGAFLPPSVAPAVTDAADISDEDALAEVLGKHSTMSAILTTRLSNLQVVKGFWAKGDVRGAISALKRSQDQSVAADVLSAVSQQRDTFKLDTIPEISPVLSDLLASSHERWQLVAIDTSATLIRAFGQVIRDTLGAMNNIGTDLSMEARRERCDASRRALQELVPRLSTLSRVGGEAGRKSNELLGEIQAL